MMIHEGFSNLVFCACLGFVSQRINMWIAHCKPLPIVYEYGKWQIQSFPKVIILSVTFPVIYTLIWAQGILA